jgi:hypothetical protein
LVADTDTVGFRIELARRATLDQAPRINGRTLHQQAVAVLDESHIHPDSLAALAFHADEAADPETVLRYGATH